MSVAAVSVKLAPASKSRVLASLLFGDHCRYALRTVVTRHNTIELFVYDAEIPDEECGLSSSVIGQADTLAQALVNVPATVRESVMSRRPSKVGQKALNFKAPVKVVGFHPEYGVKVQCLGTKQNWYAPIENLVLIGE